MAALSIAQSPHVIGAMASRRAPLSNLPNATNSPYRGTAAPLKQFKSQSNAVQEQAYGQPPPAKRKIVEAQQSVPSTPRKRTGADDVQGRVPSKLAVAKDRAASTRTARQQKPPVDEGLDTLRQWQQHYRKVFPAFVFYFESVPEELRRQCSRGIASLGAREEKFFSKDVTHVITTRPIPTAVETNTSTDPSVPSAVTTIFQDLAHPRTINPSLLEKTAEQLSGPPKSRFTFEAPTSKKLPTIVQETDVKRQGPGRVDILQKAREMGIKIWQLEKLERVLLTMLDTPPSPHGHNTRSHMPHVTHGTRQSRLPDLSQLIKNEQINGPAEREAKLAASDLIPLRGPHIYIRCMNEKTKPILVREFPKVQIREDGEWPQFRSVSSGKCPFVEEDLQARRQAENERSRGEARESARNNTVEAGAPRTRRNASAKPTRMQPPPFAGRKRPLDEIENGANAQAQPAQQLPPPAADPSFCKPATAGTIGSLNPRTRYMGGEPMASGLQASNITSAIRSQMLSSTAAAPGAKAGTSKEIHGLQRKVLERTNSGQYAGLTASKRMTDIAAAARANPRAAKQKANEKLGHRLDHIHEDSPSDDELGSRQPPNRPNAARVLKKERKDLKPGYCENCREKFDDFEEHTIGKKHRKFALTKDTWKDLDYLLAKLDRPFRDDLSDED